MSVPLLRLRDVPRDLRSWDQVFRDLNTLLQTDGDRLILAAAARLAERDSVDLSAILQRITNDGKAQDQRFLPQVSSGNVLSRQSDGPVTATAGGGTATISIASHTVQYGHGLVTYSAGTISGLLEDTNYFVYADDPNYAGGAVTYLASTNGQNITANLGRYFVGAVRTTVALTTANVSAATTTNPIQITTSAAHGWNTGDVVDFATMPGAFGTALNSGTFTITRVSGTAFTVAVDGSAFAAYTTGGTVTRVTLSAVGGNGAGGGWIDQSFLISF